MKTKGSRVVSLRAKLKTFPKRGNKIAVMSLQFNNQLFPLPAQEWEYYVLSELVPLLSLWSEVRFRRDLVILITAAYGTKPWRKPIGYAAAEINNHVSYTRLFCSEAVAIVYQTMCILEPRFNPKRFVPGDFGFTIVNKMTGTIQLAKTPLQDGWSLIPLLLLNLERLDF